MGRPYRSAPCSRGNRIAEPRLSRRDFFAAVREARVTEDPRQIIDTDLLLSRKRRAVGRAVAGADFLMQRAADDLAERMATIGRRFSRAAALFCVTPAARDVVLASRKADEALRVEADAAFLGDEPGIVAAPGHLPLDPASIDLAVSLLSLQDENDIPGMLIQIRRALKPDGLFLGAMAGAGTLGELRESLLAAEAELTGGASPRVLPFADVREVGALLQRAGFALPVTDVETVTVRYATMFDLMADLRAMGAANVLSGRSRRPATKKFFARAAQIYAERFSDPDGRIRATFSFIWMSGWTPDASQRKPLKPGSAEVSLARFLEDSEKK
jgi:SAM-dependent methyltransferase